MEGLNGGKAFIRGCCTARAYFCEMKIRNEDLGRINELKLDLLSPPYSFRLGHIATGYIDSTLQIIRKYVDENNEAITQLEQIKGEINRAADMQTIRNLCKDAAAAITYFTNAA